MVEVLVLEKEKPVEEVLKGKNLDQVLQLKVLKAVKCHCIEDCQKEDSILNKIDIAIVNLEKIQAYIDQKTINASDKINSDLLKKHKLINKNSQKLKILGTGIIKDKINIEADLISKSAMEKLEKIGGTVQIKKK